MSFVKVDATEFVTKLASSDAVPGGGGASALVGAIGAALGNMVGSLTVGKKKYADVQDDIIALKAKSDELQAELLRLVDEDAVAFEPLSKAYGIPKDDPNRDKIMEDALRVATATPLDIMRACARAIDVIEEFAAKGSALAISDAKAPPLRFPTQESELFSARPRFRAQASTCLSTQNTWRTKPTPQTPKKKRTIY